MRGILLYMLFFIFNLQAGFSQIILKGPSCVVPHVTYLYKIESKINNIDSVNICLKGGTLLGYPTNCYSGKPVSFIKVRWNKDTPVGNIVFHSTAIDTTLNVAMADTLNPGVVDSAEKAQQINIHDLPSTIYCTKASGGSCSPSYHYQWEVSIDKVHWSVIPGSTDQNLRLPFSPEKATFYRRKVMEVRSGSIAYSNTAVIYVIPLIQTKNK